MILLQDIHRGRKFTLRGLSVNIVHEVCAKIFYQTHQAYSVVILWARILEGGGLGLQPQSPMGSAAYTRLYIACYWTTPCNDFISFTFAILRFLFLKP